MIRILTSALFVLLVAIAAGAGSFEARAEAIGIEPDFTAQQPLPAPAPAASVPITPAPAIANDADLATMIGQMIIVGFVGTTPGADWVQAVKAQIASGEIGGIFYLKRNINSRAQVTELNREFLSASAAHAPFIAVDQEGGFVQRLGRRQGFSIIPSALRMAQRHGREAAGSYYANAAAEMAAAGFNLNFAPVVDLNVNPSNPVIGKVRRSYGASSDDVLDYARILIDSHRRHGVLTSIKHFPGHGSSTTDSHEALPDISRTWREEELAPYRSLIDGGYADTVMVGHLYNASLDDAGRRPATLSPVLIEGLLRGRLGYAGVVVTDDLEMKAVRDNYAFDEIVVQAIVAGNDVLLFSQTASPSRDLPRRIRAAIENAVAAGRLTRERIARSYARIVALKARLGSR